MLGKKGFTLLEIIVVLTITAILLAAMVPMGFQYLESRREQATREEIREIYNAIFGNPAKGDFGYIGDVGAFPSSLDDLVAKPGGVSSFAFHTNSVGYGWRGPYLDKDTGELIDGWGNAYDYGVVETGQIRSPGPDKDFSTTDDNIIFPYVSTGGVVEVNGTLQITAFVNDVPNPLGTTVEVYYASNGTENATPLTDSTHSDGFKFDTHHGIHAVKVEHVSNTTTTKLVNVQAIGGRQVNVEIFIRTSAVVNP